MQQKSLNIELNYWGIEIWSRNFSRSEVKHDFFCAKNMGVDMLLAIPDTQIHVVNKGSPAKRYDTCNTFPI